MATLNPQSRPHTRKRSRSRGRELAQSAHAVDRLDSWEPSSGLSWLKVAFLILAIAMVGLIIYAFVDNRFFVSEAVITGCELLDEDEVFEATGVRNWNVFWINTQDVEQRLSDSLAEIETVSVKCGLPSKLRIDIKERHPEVIWEAANGHFLLDGEGTILRPTDDLEGMIIIFDGEKRSVEGQQTLDLNFREITRTAKVLVELLGNVHRFGYTREKGIVVLDPEGYEVYFGVGGDLQHKVANMKAVAQYLREQQVRVRYVDVRVEGYPTYGPAR